MQTCVLVFLRNMSMMQKATLLCLFFWNYSTSVSENTQGTDRLHFLPGCRAVIPCQHRVRSDSHAFKWSYRKNEHSPEIMVFQQNKGGIPLHSVSQSRLSVMADGSLVITHFKEDDQGLYWCESCYQNSCIPGQSTVVTVKKEIQNDIQKTIMPSHILYVTAGSTFTHQCPGELTKSEWRFEARNTKNTSAKLKTAFVTSNKSIHIINVTTADAGKYTCWKSTCDGHRQKLLTVNLCIVTVHQREDSSVSCAVTCDVEFSHIKSTNTSTWTISLHGDEKGYLNCSENGSQPSNTSPESKNLSRVIYGTSAAAAACLILVVVSVSHFRTRLWAGFPECCSGSVPDDRVEETRVIYSSHIIRKPVRTTSSHMTDSDCVYRVPRV